MVTIILPDNDDWNNGSDNSQKGSGKLTNGAVKRIHTSSNFRPMGLKLN
ncbi:hypothetical protein [Nitrosopumilus ureiphilus]|nr:hypothetical protein [Nitrosopumilus ureiphilus]